MIQKPSQERKQPVQKINVLPRNSIGPRKTTACQVPRNNRSTIVASHRPLREVHSNVTATRPFSLASDKGNAVPSVNRESAPKLNSKSLNLKTFSAVKGKEATNVLVSFPKK